MRRTTKRSLWPQANVTMPRNLPPFGVRLNPETMKYSLDGSINVEEWKERVNSKRQRKHGQPCKLLWRKLGKSKTGISKANLVAAIEKETGVKSAYAYRIVDEAEKQKLIRRRKKDDLLCGELLPKLLPSRKSPLSTQVSYAKYLCSERVSESCSTTFLPVEFLLLPPLIVSGRSRRGRRPCRKTTLPHPRMNKGKLSRKYYYSPRSYLCSYGSYVHAPHSKKHAVNL